MAKQAAEICPKCGQVKKSPKTTEADAPARGKKWLRVPIVVPEPGDKEALEEKMEILVERWQKVTGSKPARYIVLDWALQQVIDSGVVPSDEGG